MIEYRELEARAMDLIAPFLDVDMGPEAMVRLYASAIEMAVEELLGGAWWDHTSLDIAGELSKPLPLWDVMKAVARDINSRAA